MKETGFPKLVFLHAPSPSYNSFMVLFLDYFFSASCTVAHGVGGKCMPKTV
jgi:hypothetical protein